MDIKVIKAKEMELYAEDFCTLYSMTFNDYIDKSIFRHRFLDNPYTDTCICIAVDNGRLVASYSVSPRRIYCKGRIVKAAQSINTMTHPDYMGKGLFVQTAKTLFNELKNAEYDLVYGFPNYLSNGICNAKLGWKNIYEVPTMTLEVEKFNNSGHVETKTYDISEIENLQVKQLAEICVLKEFDYLKWRYSNKSGNNYRVLMIDFNNWCIVKHYKNILNIVELHYSDFGNIQNILNLVFQYAVEKALSEVTTWSSINSSLHGVLEKQGFKNKYPITYFSAVSLRSPEIDYFDHRLWNIQMGDDNVY